MSNLTCEFCNRKFSTAFNLENHKKTAIYCLKSRGENVTKQYKCNYCDQTFTRKSSLTKHGESCLEVENY